MAGRMLAWIFSRQAGSRDCNSLPCRVSFVAGFLATTPPPQDVILALLHLLQVPATTPCSFTPTRPLAPPAHEPATPHEPAASPPRREPAPALHGPHAAAGNARALATAAAARHAPAGLRPPPQPQPATFCSRPAATRHDGPAARHAVSAVQMWTGGWHAGAGSFFRFDINMQAANSCEPHPHPQVAPLPRPLAAGVRLAARCLHRAWGARCLLHAWDVHSRRHTWAALFRRPAWAALSRRPAWAARCRRPAWAAPSPLRVWAARCRHHGAAARLA